MMLDRPDVGLDAHCVCADLGCRGAPICRFGGNGAERLPSRILARGERVRVDSGGCMRIRIVRRGLLAICAVAADGRRQILRLNVPGDAVCPMSAEGADCWCEALTETELCEFDFSRDTESLRTDPAFATMLFRMVHERLERASAHLVTLGRFDGLERICGFLADLARRTGRRQGEALRVALPMSREDIADYLGLNADTVSRLLTRVKQAGLVRFLSLGEYEVPSLAQLEARVPIALSRDPSDNPGAPPQSTGSRL